MIVDEDTAGNARADSLADKGRRMALPPPRPKVTIPHWQITDDCATTEEIETALIEMNQKGAPGIDGITAPMLKSEATTRKLLVDTISRVWSRGIVPQEWATARMILLPKTPGAQLWSQHRGITLLSVASKVLTRTILTRSATVPLAEWQFGFRRGKDTTMATAIVKHLLDESRRTNSRLVVAFIDLVKAYDSVDRRVLWETMAQYGFGEKTIRLLQAMYNDAVQVRVEGCDAGQFQSTRGLRQGCILSPLLFNIVLDRAIATVWDQLRGVDMKEHKGEGRMEVKVVGYADDLAIIATDRTRMQQNLDVMVRALASIGCAISVDKTKIMVLEKIKRVAENPPEVYASKCERLRKGHGEKAAAAAKASIVQEGERRVVHWVGDFMECPVCEFPAPESRSLQAHLWSRHDTRCAVLNTKRIRSFQPPNKASIVPGSCVRASHAARIARFSPTTVVGFLAFTSAPISDHKFSIGDTSALYGGHAIGTGNTG